MIVPRPVALLCLAGLMFQSGKIAAQTMPSPEIQGRIDGVCACLVTKVVEKGDPHACQKLQDRMATYNVPGVMCGRRPRCKKILAVLLAVGCKSCVRPVRAVHDRWP